MRCTTIVDARSIAVRCLRQAIDSAQFFCIFVCELSDLGTTASKYNVSSTSASFKFLMAKIQRTLCQDAERLRSAMEKNVDLICEAFEAYKSELQPVGAQVPTQCPFLIMIDSVLEKVGYFTALGDAFANFGKAARVMLDSADMQSLPPLMPTQTVLRRSIRNMHILAGVVHNAMKHKLAFPDTPIEEAWRIMSKFEDEYDRAGVDY